MTKFAQRHFRDRIYIGKVKVIYQKQVVCRILLRVVGAFGSDHLLP